MSEPGRTMKRAPVRTSLVTGPAGRLAGFILDFSRAIKAHRRAAKERK